MRAAPRLGATRLKTMKPPRRSALRGLCNKGQGLLSRLGELIPRLILVIDNGAAVLLPARLIVTWGHRLLLAIGDDRELVDVHP